MVAVYNVRTGEYVFVNNAVYKILGYRPSDFICGGLKFSSSLIHPKDVSRVTEKNQQALDEANKSLLDYGNHEPVISFEYRVRHASGKWVWLHTEGSVYDRTSEGSAEHVLNISIDITERKKTEEKLPRIRKDLEARVKKHTERLELALEASKMGTWEWDVETGALIWSPEMMKLYGIDPKYGNITIEKFFGALHPDDRAMKQRVLEHATETGEPYQVEHRCVWPDGSMHWILGQGKAFMKNGKAHRMIGTAMNVDERKVTEAALEASQLRYKTLFNSTILGIFIIDLGGRIYEANDKWLAIMGYSKKDLAKGKLRWDTMTPPEYRTTEKEKIQDLKSSGEATPWEKEYFRKDKSRIPVLVGMVRIPKTPDLCVGIVSDITERQRLIALNEAKDEFISIASHQLRTPATSVKQYTGMLLAGYVGELTNKQFQLVQTAYNSNERQLNIIDELLQVAQVDSGTIKLNKSRCDIVKLVKTAIEDSKISIQKRKQKMIIFSHAQPQLLVSIDADMMLMAIENLLDNASKYSEKDTQISLFLQQTKQHIILKIKDQGVGIADKDLIKLYQKFSRLDNPFSVSAGGTGLGLYWVKRVIDAHDGSIDLVSKLNQGTTFTIKLPINKKK